MITMEAAYARNDIKKKREPETGKENHRAYG
jgi:hypothetical protein